MKHVCPRCRCPFEEPRPDHSTYVVNGQAVCNFICYMEATNGPMHFTAERKYDAPIVSTV